MTRFTTTALALALGLAAGSLVSCSSVKSSMKKVSTPMKNLAQLNSNDWKMFKLRDLRTNAPPIVKVRPDDLKKMKTSEEHILAWNRAKRASRYAASTPTGTFLMPEDFDPSFLADGDFVPTAGILPSLNPGNTSDVPALEDVKEQGELPAEVPPAE